MLSSNITLSRVCSIYVSQWNGDVTWVLLVGHTNHFIQPAVNSEVFLRMLPMPLVELSITFSTGKRRV